MATHTTDFWPDDIGQSELRAPVALLREQAAALGEKTKNVVTAEVASSSESGSIVHDLYIVAPAIHYRYQLLTIRHPLLLYPMQARVPSTILWTTLESEEEFIHWLKTTLTSDRTKKAIQAMIAQSQGQ